MKIQTPPGMRDFYPEDMRLQNWLFDLWRRVSRAFAFQEYEGPIFEFLDLYRLKSGEGIVAELFSFQDRGGRDFAIRPEMTPTLARMVAARANTLPRPIKWFSIPRMCRAEKPQRGRLREFFQWNVDVLGSEDMLADAEVMAVAAQFFRAAGLTDADFVLRYSHRALAAATLTGLGIPPQNTNAAFQWIDRFDKLSEADFARGWSEQVAGACDADRIRSFLTSATVDECVGLAESAGDAGQRAGQQLAELRRRLDTMGVGNACEFDFQIVRGLAYYTGSVFEAHLRQGGLRALAGGGRYDDLTGLLDGPRVPGVGFGMGDAPVLEALRSAGRLPTPTESIDVVVIEADESLFDDAVTIAAALRNAGLNVELPYKRGQLSKQLKRAAESGTRVAIIVGSEYRERRELQIKHLRSGTQQAAAAEAFLSDPRATLRAAGVEL